MKKLALIIIAFYAMSASGFAQADMVQFHIRTNVIMQDSITESDSVTISYLMKLTDKTTTQRVYVYLGTEKEKADVDSVMFNITNSGGVYYATSNELGTSEIVVRTLIAQKNYHKNDAILVKWATAYLIDSNNQESEKKYYRNFLPE